MVTKADSHSWAEDEQTGHVHVEPAKARAVRKLSLACGQHKPPGYTGIDLAGDADITHDLFVTPWPVKSNSVAEAECSHFVEHIPHYLPQFEGKDGWFVFFDELYRVMKPGGVVTIVCPYNKSDRADWDPTHTRRIHEMSFWYLNKGWREAQGLDHYSTICDFDAAVAYSGLSDDHMTRSEDQQAYQRNHLWNIIPDLSVTLRALK